MPRGEEILLAIVVILTLVVIGLCVWVIYLEVNP